MSQPENSAPCPLLLASIIQRLGATRSETSFDRSQEQTGFTYVRDLTPVQNNMYPVLRTSSTPDSKCNWRVGIEKLARMDGILSAPSVTLR